jgi:Ala-tRNA(Pro) deacylase
MPATPADLFTFLDRIGVVHATIEHPPLFTVEQSRALRGQIPGGHTKNLFLKDKKGVLFLVTALEDAQIALKTLHHRFGSGRFSFGSPDAMRATLGVEPGSVTPFGAINDTGHAVNIVLDRAMLEHASLNYQHDDDHDFPRRPVVLSGGNWSHTPDRAGIGRDITARACAAPKRAKSAAGVAGTSRKLRLQSAGASPFNPRAFRAAGPLGNL